MPPCPLEAQSSLPRNRWRGCCAASRRWRPSARRPPTGTGSGHAVPVASPAPSEEARLEPLPQQTGKGRPAGVSSGEGVGLRSRVGPHSRPGGCRDDRPKAGVAPGVLGHPSSAQGYEPHRNGSSACLASSPAPCPSQVMAERVLRPAAWEPWLLQRREGRQHGSAIPRRSACQPGQGPGQRRL